MRTLGQDIGGHMSVISLADGGQLPLFDDAQVAAK
jgi:hypothetical protein